MFRLFPPACSRCLLILLFAAGSHAWAWGCAGHQIIAFIALRHLDPATRAAADAILAADARPGRPAATCPAAGLPPLVAAANWADSVRNGSTAPEHYTNLPLALDRDAPRARSLYAQACAARCVSWAIRHYSQQLTDSGDIQAQGKALRYLDHFVGDAHQPLHAVASDRGGTMIEVHLPGSHRETTLHAAWDSGILAGLMDGLTPASYAAQLDQRLGSAVEAEIAAEPDPDSPEAWAWQSHALAAQYALGLLPPGGGQLSPAYLAQAQAVIPQQLERAGICLARLLQRELGAKCGADSLPGLGNDLCQGQASWAGKPAPVRGGPTSRPVSPPRS